MLDTVGYCQQYLEEQPEDLLEYSDWMGIPMQSYAVGLDRFKALLLEQVRVLDGV